MIEWTKVKVIGGDGEDRSPPPDPAVWSKAVAVVRGEHRTLFISTLIHQLTITARIGYVRAAGDLEAAFHHLRKHNELIHGVIQEVMAALEDEGTENPVEWLEVRRRHAYGVGIGSELDYAIEAAVDKLAERRRRRSTAN